MAAKKTKKEFNIWEGIYKTFKEAPVVGLGFSSDTWLKKSQEKVTRMIKLIKEEKLIPEFVVYRENLLPVLITLITKKGVLKIIDFGGNLGQEYLSILHSTNIKSKDLKYIVIEKSDVCEIGNKLFKGNKGIQFQPYLPPTSLGTDIIHVGTTLQYIENWKELVKQFTDLHPSYILFTDLQAGDIPTYVTSQNYYGSKMPVWFFNVSEIREEFKKYGYILCFKSTFRGSFFGQEQDRPQLNLPKKFRLKNSCNLLFIKSNTQL